MNSREQLDWTQARQGEARLERYQALQDMDPLAQRLLDWAVPGHVNRIEQLLGPDRGE